MDPFQKVRVRLREHSPQKYSIYMQRFPKRKNASECFLFLPLRPGGWGGPFQKVSAPVQGGSRETTLPKRVTALHAATLLKKRNHMYPISPFPALGWWLSIHSKKGECQWKVGGGTLERTHKYSILYAATYERM